MKKRKEELEKEKNNITEIYVPRTLQYEHNKKLIYRIFPSCTPKCLEFKFKSYSNYVVTFKFSFRTLKLLVQLFVPHLHRTCTVQCKTKF